jgi:hypothetical protein
MKLLLLPRLLLLPLPRLLLPPLLLLCSLGTERLVVQTWLRSHLAILMILRLQTLQWARRGAGACLSSRLKTTLLLP